MFGRKKQEWQLRTEMVTSFQELCDEIKSLRVTLQCVRDDVYDIKQSSSVATYVHQEINTYGRRIDQILTLAQQRLTEDRETLRYNSLSERMRRFWFVVTWFVTLPIQWADARRARKLEKLAERVASVIPSKPDKCWQAPSNWIPPQ